MEKAVPFLDQEFLKSYELLLRNAAQESASTNGTGENTQPRSWSIFQSTSPAITMYIISTCEVFIRTFPSEGRLKEAIDYYQKQSARLWQDYKLYAKGMIALVQHRKRRTRSG